MDVDGYHFEQLTSTQSLNAITIAIVCERSLLKPEVLSKIMLA